MGTEGLSSTQWYDTNTPNFAHGPTGSGLVDANSGPISNWDEDDALMVRGPTLTKPPMIHVLPDFGYLPTLSGRGY